eukprot:g1510.t1
MGEEAQYLVEYARYLGMKPFDEPELLWIAEAALSASLPEGWQEWENDNGEVYYFNEMTGTTQWEHPAEQYYRDLYQAMKKQKGRPPPQQKYSSQNRKRYDHYSSTPSEIKQKQKTKPRNKLEANLGKLHSLGGLSLGMETGTGTFGQTEDSNNEEEETFGGLKPTATAEDSTPSIDRFSAGDEPLTVESEEYAQMFGSEAVRKLNARKSPEKARRKSESELGNNSEEKPSQIILKSTSNIISNALNYMLPKLEEQQEEEESEEDERKASSDIVSSTSDTKKRGKKKAKKRKEKGKKSSSFTENQGDHWELDRVLLTFAASALLLLGIFVLAVIQIMSARQSIAQQERLSVNQPYRPHFLQDEL